MSYPPNHESIIGGHAAPSNGDFGFQLVLLFKGMLHCGGFILSPRFAGTAAHCLVEESPFNFAVGYGSIDRKQLRFADVSQVFAHKNFNRANGNFDIGLIKIVGKFRGENVAPIPLAHQRPSSNTILSVSGWGITQKRTHDHPQMLKAAEISLIDFWQCRQYFLERNIFITSNVLCARDKLSSPCSGDSGGPLTYNGSLVGVVSWSDTTCMIFPTVYTDVTAPAIAEWLKWHLN